MTTEITQKNEIIYECKFCDFITSKKTDYNRHNLTQKHKNNTSTTDNNEKNEKTYFCGNCFKSFNDRAGLWRHKNKCNIVVSGSTVE